MKRRPILLAFVLAVGLGGSGQAQMTVFDPSNYAKAEEEALTALSQLEQLKQQVADGQALLTSLNHNSGVNGMAAELQAPQTRSFLPGIDAFVAAGKGDLAQLGGLSLAAQSIRSQNRVYTPQPGDALGRDIETQGDRAARDLAASQAIGAAAQTRLTGLQQLQTALSTAGDARAVMDLQARIQAEQAMIANDQMRLQGLAMTQAAEDRMQQQRQREQMEADRDARMAMYRKSF